MKKIVPPFTKETAAQKVQAAEDAWNSKNPEKISLAYSIDSLVFYRQQNIRKVRIRMATCRNGPMVQNPRQRALGIRFGGPYANTGYERQ